MSGNYFTSHLNIFIRGGEKDMLPSKAEAERLQLRRRTTARKIS
jgi:hypothetical protein